MIESDTGKKREVNEDRAAVLKRQDGLLLAMVADGMGGHKAGDVASEMTISILSKLFSEEKLEAFSTVENRKAWLTINVQRVNRLVYDHSLTNPECKGMGTTLIAALIDNEDCVICHIGDSRAYVINETVEQVTRDHSYVNVLVDSGEISEEEAEFHPKKNWIIKALGTEPDIDGEILHFTLAQSSYLLICSDGLSNKVSKADLADIVLSTEPLSQKGKDLVDLANDLGGEDNITVVLLASMAEEG